MGREEELHSHFKVIFAKTHSRINQNLTTPFPKIKVLAYISCVYGKIL